MEGKQNIKDVPIGKIPEMTKAFGLKSFTANQIIQWLYQKNVTSFDEMTNLSKETRKTLAENFYISRLKLHKILESTDGTKKFAWKLSDGNIIESVAIPSEAYKKVRDFGDDSKIPDGEPRTRITLCISTQVGCAMGCAFCRTGEMGFVRNLSQSEIIDQILGVALEMKLPAFGQVSPAATRIANVVLMGMGEPFANYDNVVNAIKIMIDHKCLYLSKRHVTLSTSGLVPEIEKFAKDNLGIKLAISLNGTTDKQREQLMPINKKYPLTKLFETLKKYSNATNHDRITFEYVMVGDYNDSGDDAKRLVKLLSHIPSKVNLIPLNPFTGSPRKVSDTLGGDLKAPTEESIQRFAQYLRNKNIQVNVRTSRGQDILAACGQLAT